MNEEFNYLGTWWLPSNPDKKWSGVVTYNPDTGIELKLVAHRQDVWHETTLNNVNHVEVLKGEVGEYPHKVTLLNVSPHRSTGGRTRIMYNVWLHAEFLLDGHHFDKMKEITFESLEVDYSSLGSWMGSTNKKMKDKWDIPITYKETSVQITFRKGPLLPSSPQRNYIHIKPDSVKELTWYFGITDSIRDLLAFLVGRTVVIKGMSTPIDRGRMLGSKYVRIYRQIAPVDDFLWLGTDFPLQQIDAQIAKVFRSWFDFDEDHRIPFELCLDVINNIHGYKKFEFLALMQALESHHQLYFEREGRKKKRWLTDDGKVRGPTLLERLRDLQDSFPGEMNLSDGFLNRAKVTRNYYTHYDPKKRKLAWKDDNLSRAISRLVPFVAYFLYNKINLPDDVFFKPFEGYSSRWLWQRQQPDSPYSEFKKQSPTS